MRYAEEVELLLEEMRRVLAFLEWDRDRWNKHALHIRQSADTITHSLAPSHAQGKIAVFEEDLRGYALRQALVRQCLFTAFTQQWHDVPAFITLTNQGLVDEEIAAVDNTE